MLIERIEGTETLSNDSSKFLKSTGNAFEHSEYTESPSVAGQITPSTEVSYISRESHECTSDFERHSSANGPEIDNHSAEHNNGDRIEMTNANGFAAENEQFSHGEQFGDDQGNSNVFSSSMNRQIIALRQSNIPQNPEQEHHGDEWYRQDIDKLRQETAMDLHGSTNDTVALDPKDSLQQVSDTASHHSFCFENNRFHQNTENTPLSSILCDNNYNCLLVTEAIKQLEKDNEINSQQMNVQLADITTTADLHTDMQAQTHLETISTDQIDIGQMDTIASEQPPNSNRSRSKETSSAQLSCSKIGDKRHLTDFLGTNFKYLLINYN